MYITDEVCCFVINENNGDGIFVSSAVLLILGIHGCPPLVYCGLVLFYYPIRCSNLPTLLFLQKKNNLLPPHLLFV